MDKKDLYEYLAKIYLDTTSKRKKKTPEYPKVFKNLFFVIAIAFILAITAFWSIVSKNRPLNAQVSLILQNDVAKINFHFDPAKKETYSLDLNQLNLKPFKALGFSLKKANYKDNIALRVEFVSSFKEKSAVYFKNIPHKWQDYKINLTEFKEISNWSKISSLSFIIEEWNVREKRGVVYIDNIRLLR